MQVHERLAMFLDREPQIHQSARVARSAEVYGAVTLEAEVSIWPLCVLRADINTIRVGRGSNIQDGTVIHLADDCGVDVGEDTTVGHAALLHGCRVGNECLVGMRAVILDGAEVGDQSIIGAGSLVTKGMEIPPGSLVMGSPARIKRELSEEERAAIKEWAAKYRKVSAGFVERGIAF